jgi:hypothetical protein
MNARFIRIALQYAGGCVAIVFFVVLLTLVFSFLGTIFCSILAGMMLGAARQSRWQCLPFSFVFPAVIYGLLHYTRAELSPRQGELLAVLCFCAFWVTYFAGAALISFERKTPPGLKGAAEVAAGPAAPEPAVSLTLQELQGQWCWNNGRRNGERSEKVLEIKDDQLALRALGSDGRVRWEAKGAVKLEHSEANGESDVHVCI